MNTGKKDKVRCDLIKQLEKGTSAHILGWNSEDSDILIQTVKNYLEDEDYGLEITESSPSIIFAGTDTNTDKLLYVPLQSVQGVILSPVSEGSMFLVLPVFCSPVDVMLFFIVVRALRKVNGDCRVIWRDSGKEIYPTDERIAEVYARNLESTYNELDYPGHRKVVEFPTPMRDYYAMPLPEGSETERIQYTVRVLESMRSTLWEFLDVKNAPMLYPEEDSKNIISFLDNRSERIVDKCTSIGLIDSQRKTKMVSRKTFVERMQGHPCFEMIDAVRFVIRKMDAAQWNELWKSFRVSVVPTPPKSMLS